MFDTKLLGEVPTLNTVRHDKDTNWPYKGGERHAPDGTVSTRIGKTIVLRERAAGRYKWFPRSPSYSGHGTERQKTGQWSCSAKT